ncbi:DUF1648 domain-containing protein [Xylanimonas ulmi]|uniref:DUF1648 domain-containing protein n=1 Tax=Xylanimonas ulmi TaxID=228973 RepID=A0A4Q7M101_9MICO|nr:DUF1648 domain-containing protein [Xylanibacterium ulmi]RZS61476.1 hypothetical protein EV386_1778 [Xylanibacterium ulmi]
MTPHPVPTTPIAPWRPRARRAALGSAAAALALLGAAAMIALSWREDLPDPVAAHWGSGPAPDGFSSLDGFVTVLALVGVGCVALLSAIAWLAGHAATTRRVLAATNVWIGGLLALALVGSLWGQRGLSNAALAPGPGGVIALATLGPILPAVAAALLVPGDPPLPATAPVPAEAPRSSAVGEAAVWTGQARGGPGLVALGAAATAVTVGAAVLAQVWALVGLAALIALMLASMGSWGVRVDASGLTVRSALGWPRTRIPAAEVERAGVTQVNAFTDFGGWGWRVGRGGRIGIVPRSGPALVVERTGGRSLVVTVDDAESGAALLNTMADRARR